MSVTVANGWDGCSTNYWTFPAGERGVRIENLDGLNVFSIYCHFTGSDDIIDLLQTVEAIRGHNPDAKINLEIPYFPYARQDRRMNAGEPHSMKVIANLINSCKFEVVEVWDPHSDVVEALVNNVKIIPQQTLFGSSVALDKVDVLLSPDGGALKKIFKVAKLAPNAEVVCAQKVRDTKTGDIVGVWVPDMDKLAGKRVWVVDDICDGGRTFIELAKAIDVVPASLNLYVTHGIFSKGKDELSKYYSKIVSPNDFSKA